MPSCGSFSVEKKTMCIPIMSISAVNALSRPIRVVRKKKYIDLPGFTAEEQKNFRRMKIRFGVKKLGLDRISARNAADRALQIIKESLKKENN
jgi:hypothetical protein